MIEIIAEVTTEDLHKWKIILGANAIDLLNLSMNINIDFKP